MEAIKTKDLTKEFGDLVAVDHLNLTIKDNELFGLLGVNGAGKTTTIRMLTGLSKPTSGDAIVLGKSIVNEMQSIKEYVNISPQETAIAPNLSVKENIEFIAELYKIDPKNRDKIVKDMIDQFKLNKIVKKKAKLLSGGWQRRLSIAMALVTSPKLLFLDEPTLGLDVLARRELWEIIKNIQKHTTIILTTHYMEEAEVLCDRIAIMVDGKIKEIGSAKELMKKTNTKTFEEAFVKIATKEAK